MESDVVAAMEARMAEMRTWGAAELDEQIAWLESEYHRLGREQGDIAGRLFEAQGVRKELKV